MQPGSTAELVEIVGRAAGEGQALFPIGGGTMLDLGLPPSRAGLAVDMRGLDAVVDYPARDLTITVQAGITLARLQELLRAENQCLPVDVPQAARSTLGGAMASNVSGPRRYGHGTFRDFVIGISVINDLGQEVKAGGRVVKNVAGYDLCKLHIGALGTLGIITQVTLKLRPLPEERALVLLGCVPAEVASLLEQLSRTRTRPVCVEVLNHKAAEQLNEGGLPDAPRLLVIGFEGNREAVGWQVQQLVHELSPGGTRGLEARFGSTSDQLWHSLVEFANQQEATWIFKANLLPSATAEFFERAATLSADVRLQAHAGNGIVIGQLPDSVTLEEVKKMLEVLHPLAAASQGNIILPRCPAAWKKVLPVWGTPRGDAWLMRVVKEKLDPGNLFNPGRLC